VQQEKSGVQMN